MDDKHVLNLEQMKQDFKIGQGLFYEEVTAELDKLKMRLGDEEFAMALEYFFPEENSPDVLKYIIKQFDKLRPPEAFELLVDFLLMKRKFEQATQECEKYVSARIMCAKVLGNYKDTRAVLPLLYCLNNKEEDYKLRLECAEALGKVGDKYAVTPLIDVVTDEDEKSVYLRESAAHALGMIGDMQAIDPLVSILEAQKGMVDKFTYLKERVIEALGRLSSPNSKVIRALGKSLRDDSPHIRIGAIEALMNTDDDCAIPMIKQMLLDKDVEVTKNAVIALYNILGESILHEIIASSEFSEATKSEAQEILDIESDHVNDDEG